MFQKLKLFWRKRMAKVDYHTWYRTHCYTCKSLLVITDLGHGRVQLTCPNLTETDQHHVTMQAYRCPTCNEISESIYGDSFSTGQGMKYGSLVKCKNAHLSVHVDGQDPVVIPSDYESLHEAYRKARELAEFGRQWDAWQDSIHDPESEVVMKAYEKGQMIEPIS